MDVEFDVTKYGPAVAALLTPLPVMSLGKGRPNAALRPLLAAIDLPPACRAGLWLVHDFWDESHDIAQDLHTTEGSYWHAIQHRREPDAGNAKYWWRKVGPHPVLDSLAEHAPALGYNYTNPFAFVDFCERVRAAGTPDEELAKRVQILEWRLLFDHCYRSAVG